MQHPKGGRKCTRRTPTAFIFYVHASRMIVASAQKIHCEPSKKKLRALGNIITSPQKYYCERS